MRGYEAGFLRREENYRSRILGCHCSTCPRCRTPVARQPPLPPHARRRLTSWTGSRASGSAGDAGHRRRGARTPPRARDTPRSSPHSGGDDSRITGSPRSPRMRHGCRRPRRHRAGTHLTTSRRARNSPAPPPRPTSALPLMSPTADQGPLGGGWRTEGGAGAGGAGRVPRSDGADTGRTAFTKYSVSPKQLNGTPRCCLYAIATGCPP